MSKAHQPFGLSWQMEKFALQAAVALGSLVPILAGGAGMIYGVSTLAGDTGITATSLDSHVRYLSGLLLAIGLGFASTIVGIETHGRRFRFLSVLVVVGGIGRLIGLIVIGPPPLTMMMAAGMELLVTPLLALWQAHLARTAPYGERCL